MGHMTITFMKYYNIICAIIRIFQACEIIKIFQASKNHCIVNFF